MIDSSWPAGATRLFLVRHGETETATRGVIAGRHDVALSERGLEQARAVGALLSRPPLAAVYSSTSRRALDSARLIAEPHRLEPLPDPDLCEIDFGLLEGLTFDEVAERHPETAAEWLSRPHEVVFPGGECLALLQKRVVRGVEAIMRRHPSASIALVCHAGPIRALLGAVLGLAPEGIFHLECAPASVTVLGVDGELGLARAITVIR